MDMQRNYNNKKPNHFFVILLEWGLNISKQISEYIMPVQAA